MGGTQKTGVATQKTGAAIKKMGPLEVKPVSLNLRNRPVRVWMTENGSFLTVSTSELLGYASCSPFVRTV